jgi:hypothetical protein
MGREQLLTGGNVASLYAGEQLFVIDAFHGGHGSRVANRVESQPLSMYSPQEQ